MRTSRVPVLVVGAGPAGTLLALELARRGVHVRIVDRLVRPATTSRGIRLHAATLELLDRIDKRLAARFIDRGVPIAAEVTHRVDASGKRQVTRAEVGSTTAAARYAFDLVHRQSETELYLREYTSAHHGVSPDWGSACVEVRQDEDGVIAALMSDGAVEEVQCRYLVACDGASSTVRERLGLPSSAGGAGATVLHELDAVLDGFPPDAAAVHRCEGPDHRLTIVELPGGLHRLELELARNGAAESPIAPARFLALVNCHFDSVTVREAVAYECWSPGEAGVPAYRSGRVLLAGDAARIRYDTQGAGVNAALEDAFNLGWKLAFVVKGLAAESLLGTYEVERNASGGRRGRAARAQSAAGPAVGDWAPDADLGGGRAVFDSRRWPLYTLLGLAATEEGARPLGASLKPFAESLAAVLRVRVLEPSPALVACYGSSAVDRLILVRPDGEVAYRCTANEIAALDAHLRSVVALPAE